MDMANDMELERIDKELRRHDERRKKILERKNRRIRQIRERQLKDKEAWMKRFLPLLDKTLAEKIGVLYWYDCGVEEICAGISQMEIPVALDLANESDSADAKEEISTEETAAQEIAHAEPDMDEDTLSASDNKAGIVPAGNEED
ncbi:MAG: hypothetical protein IJ820_00700 [Lachnospiraceae bacterium]|nr:hypothetical protein [Lachnospiraceae bacterium]